MQLVKEVQIKIMRSNSIIECKLPKSRGQTLCWWDIMESFNFRGKFKALYQELKKMSKSFKPTISFLEIYF